MSVCNSLAEAEDKNQFEELNGDNLSIHSILQLFHLSQVDEPVSDIGMWGRCRGILFHIKDDMTMPNLLVWPDNNMEYFEVTDFYTKM